MPIVYCVGGPHDGQRVRTNRPHFEIAERPAAPLARCDAGGMVKAPEEIVFRLVRYEVETIRVGEETIHVALPQWHDFATALKHVFNSYCNNGGGGP